MVVRDCAPGQGEGAEPRWQEGAREDSGHEECCCQAQGLAGLETRIWK